MRCLFLLGLFVGPFLLAAPPSPPPLQTPAPEAAGSITTLKGAAFILRGGQRLPAAIGARLFPQDGLQTGHDGSIGVVLRDDTALSLGPDSEVALKDFVFQPKDGLFASVLRLVKGTMVYLSGRIAKLAPNSMKVETPVGVVAVRGTKFLVKADG